MDEKVTIVVPVYNVEKYLDRCVNSLLHQTVHNYQIILVDDGSTDGSGKKCDDWALKVDIITTFHKANGGLSDARNYGTQYVTTEYVTFVDSDDYVEPQYIELLLKGLDTGADMVVTHHVQEPESIPQKALITDEYVTYSSEEALNLLCYEKITTSADGKLIPKEYILEDPFPVGKLYEDLLTVYKYIGRSEKISFNKSEIYHYVQRKGSIRQGKWNEKCFDVMEGANNLLQYLDSNYPQLHEAGVFRYFYSANELYVRAFASKNYLNTIRTVRKKLQKNYKSIFQNRAISFKYKMQFLLMAIQPELYKWIWICKKRKSFQ